ncbi:MAG: hypothetical protein IPM98_14270 [Lewinellaceae bacterium]|nr:hypothetical protein [Lewinellaceae bacterium]
MVFLLGLAAGVVLTLLVTYLRSRTAAPEMTPATETVATTETAQMEATETEEMPAKRDVVVGSANNGRSNKSTGVTKTIPTTTTTTK